MKNYALPMLLSLSLSAPLFAADAPPPPKAPEAAKAQTAPASEAQATAAPVAAASTKIESVPVAALAANTDNESLQKARAAHMQAMHERMAKIWATEDPQARQKLMAEHQQAMQDFRQNMQNMMNNRMPQRYGRGWGGQGMNPGYGRGWGQGMNPNHGMGKGRHHKGHRGGMMCQKHDELEQRLNKIETMLKQLTEKQ